MSDTPSNKIAASRPQQANDGLGPMRQYRFGDFELDLDAFELRRRGESLKLERRPLDLLALLVQNAGRLVSREEIIAALWPPKIIIDFDSGLNTLVRKVRNVLDDSSEEPKFIETVPGRGYRFVAPVEPVVSVAEPPSGVTSPAQPAAVVGGGRHRSAAGRHGIDHLAGDEHANRTRTNCSAAVREPNRER